MRKIVLTLVALATILPAQAAADNLEDLQRERREVQQFIQRLKHDLAVHAAEIAALKSMLLQLIGDLERAAPVAAPTVGPMCGNP
jgi:hypothetical protein